MKLNKQISAINYFKAPEEAGGYIFLIYSDWDNGHNVNYIFKINVI